MAEEEMALVVALPLHISFLRRGQAHGLILNREQNDHCWVILTQNNFPLLPNTDQDIYLNSLTETYSLFYHFSQECLFNKILQGILYICSETS